MTLERFNRHLHQLDQLLLVIPISALHCDIVFYMLALSVDAKGNFDIMHSKLEAQTGDRNYHFPLKTSMIKEVTYSPLILNSI